VGEDAEVRKLLEDLADDTAASATRADVCDTIARGLVRLGHVLWVGGYVVGPDRASGTSPFRFGDDRAVGVATVAQIGGELSSAAVDLLKANNRYAASALIRQLVEVEYLAAAFADEHEIAGEWLRASREERIKFWSPARLRERAGGRFLKTDYWHHCEMGGHPATPGMALLPGHANGVHAVFLWADLAGHLVGIWRAIVRSTDRFLDGPVPRDWELPDVQAAIDEWLGTDGLYAALQDLGAILHGDVDTSSAARPEPERRG
jgi:hypothetical protein